MPAEQIDTLVVGGGQAGLAMSEHLGVQGVQHIVLERFRIAERWRTERWDSLVANGPAWHDRFPGMEIAGIDPDGFATKDDMAAYFETYAGMIDCPIRCGVTVEQAARIAGGQGFHVQTSHGDVEARNLVVATGPFQRPILPSMVPETAGIRQIHSTGYRNPGQLNEGAVLVVGAGSSGAQIAEELLDAGCQVYLSIGPHDRPPRSYRGRDYCWWLGVLGKWDAPARQPGTEHVTISVSGAKGGHTIDFRRFAHAGMTLLGRTEGFSDGHLHFADDLACNIAKGDANYLSVLDAADAYVVAQGLDLPAEPQARAFSDMPDCVTHPIRALNLAAAGIKTIIWATGFAPDYAWLDVDVLDAHGAPVHQRGVTTAPGLYFLGLSWQSRRGSAFIWGVWHDAKYIADQIGIQRSYLQYHTQAQRQAGA